jgi:hypothetical protein
MMCGFIPDRSVREKALSAVLWLSLGAIAATGQQNPTPHQPLVPSQAPEKQSPSHNAEFFHKATNGSIFIYDDQHDPCAALPPNLTLLPLGSGFVAGIEKKGVSTPQLWNGWKFLITAKHVVANHNEIVIRVNAENESKLVCKTVKLETQGKEQNVVSAPSGVDLVGILLPQLEGADPTVVTSSLLIDEAKMKEWSIGVGTEVLTIGYLFSYSGQKANFPVAKFGHISLMSGESWYFNPESRMMEQGYALDLSNAPGLSGAPVYTHGVEIETNPFRYRDLPPYLVGVVKGLMLAPVNGQLISQGVAVIEPGTNLKALMRQIATMLKSKGADVVERCHRDIPARLQRAARSALVNQALCHSSSV